MLTLCGADGRTNGKLQSNGGGGYNTVAPPTATGGGGAYRSVPGIAKPFSIQAQMGKRKTSSPANEVLAAVASPAYVKV